MGVCGRRWTTPFLQVTAVQTLQRTALVTCYSQPGTGCGISMHTSDLRACMRQAVDSAFLQFTVAQTLQRTASVHLLFAFEYVIQASIVVSTFCKYALAAVDRCDVRAMALLLYGLYGVGFRSCWEVHAGRTC